MKVFVAHHVEAKKEAKYIKKFLEDNYDKLDVDIEINKYKDMNYEDDFIKRIIKQDYIGHYNLILFLLSPNSWKNRDLDWTIASALQHPKQGLLVIMTKEYGKKIIEDETKTPSRLLENVKSGYGLLFTWNDLFSTKYYDLYFILDVLKAAADNPEHALSINSRKLMKNDF